jgi:hypothetical protein
MVIINLNQNTNEDCQKYQKIVNKQITLPREDHEIWWRGTRKKTSR